MRAAFPSVVWSGCAIPKASRVLPRDFIMSCSVVEAQQPSPGEAPAAPDPRVDSPSSTRATTALTSKQAAELLQSARDGCGELMALCESAPALRESSGDSAQITSVTSASLKAVCPRDVDSCCTAGADIAHELHELLLAPRGLAMDVPPACLHRNTRASNALIRSTTRRAGLQVAPYIEGQRLNLEDLVQALSRNATDDAEAVQNKIKNLVFTEATRKSYCHDRRAFNVSSVRAPGRPGPCCHCYCRCSALHMCKRVATNSLRVQSAPSARASWRIRRQLCCGAGR